MPSLEPPFGAIPESPAEFTASWLAAVLTRRGYSAAIESIEFQPVEAGALTSRITRVVPRMQDETTGVAPALLWKRSLEDPAARQEFQRGYAQEVRFYREIAPTVSIAVPRCFVATHDAESGAHVLLLEDLSPAAAPDLTEGVTLEQAAAVLGSLARLHAAQWRSAGSAVDADRFAHLEALVERWGAVSEPFLREHVDERAGARSRRYARTVGTHFTSLASGPQTLVHGDLHPANVLFTASEQPRPTLIDWQGSGTGAPIRDVARFLTLGLPTELRREQEETLLADYLDHLESNGVRYDPTAAARDYRTASLLQWGWAVIFFRLESAWDPATRAAMPTLARRAAAAFDDASGGLDRA